MVRERDYKPIEIPQTEPLVILRNQKFFPFSNLELPEETIGHFDFASQEFQLQEEDGITTGRFLYQDVMSNGNTAMWNFPFLAEKYYTLGSTEDDLKQYTETYPDSPHRRIMFKVAFDLPRPMDPESEFRKTTRIRVENGQTGNVFYAVEARAQGGYDRTRSPKDGHYAILYDSFYYKGEQWDDRLNKHAHLDIPEERWPEIHQQVADYEEDNSKPYPQELADAHRRVREEDDRRSYLMPFRLSIITKPEVARGIALTIEQVPMGSVDLSVNTPDQVLHGH